jgi:hypothetical protein
MGNSDWKARSPDKPSDQTYIIRDGVMQDCNLAAARNSRMVTSFDALADSTAALRNYRAVPATMKRQLLKMPVQGRS